MPQAARAVARDFLQSVVVVDDRASLGVEVSGVAGASSPPAEDAELVETRTSSAGRGRSQRRLWKLQVPAGVGLGVPEQALDAKVLVDGFAQEGLVCAVIRPGPGESPVERTVQASRRADIVILDWELNGDDGESALSIIRRLVHEEAEAKPHGRLRLIALYSGALTLRQIATRIRQDLRQAGSSRFRKDGEFAITAGSVRITVLAKPSPRLRRADRLLQDRVVTADRLPDRLVDEFATMTMGLVPHVALASLAALRRNMHRVLGRLSAELDPGYLWHRATQTRPVDAETHLVDLVAGELRSVLEDERVGEWADIDAIRHWIARDGRSDFSSAFGESVSRSGDDVLALLDQGAAGRAENNRVVREKFSKMCVEGSGAHKHEGIAGFASTPEGAKRANEQLAALMSLRTRYEHPPPQLDLGTILARGRGSSRTYWLCVQPRCDSVRLKGHTAFPLLPLTLVEPRKKFDILIPDNRNGFLRFRLSKKPADIDMAVFAVTPSDGDTVLAETYGKGFAFTARNGRRYSWIAELKAEHAQRVAQQVANEFSRVGLTESEWLRLWATKS